MMPPDDRLVRDSERKAALMHFDSSQVREYCTYVVRVYIGVLMFHIQAAELRHQEVNSQISSGEQDNIPKQSVIYSVFHNLASCACTHTHIHTHTHKLVCKSHVLLMS